MAPRTFSARSAGSSFMPCSLRPCSAHCSRTSCSVSPLATKSQSTPTSLQVTTFDILPPREFSDLKLSLGGGILVSALELTQKTKRLVAGFQEAWVADLP